MSGTRPGRPTTLLDGAVRWVDRNLHRFDPRRSDDPAVVEVALTELAALTLTALRCGDGVPRRTVTGWLDLLEAVHHDPVHRQRPYRDPDRLVPVLMVAAALARGGRIDVTGHGPALHRLVRANGGRLATLPAHRAMAVRHLLDLTGVPHTLPPYRTLFQAALPPRPVNPIFLSTADAHQVVRVVVHTTDLGQRTAAGIDDAEQGRLAALVERLLGMRIAAGDWELTAGLLLAQWSLGRPGPHSEVGWRCLVEAQRPDGAVPGRADAVPRPASDTTDGGRDFAAVHHPTLVSALAALLCGRQRRG